MSRMLRVWRRVVRSLWTGRADEAVDREMAAHIGLLEESYRRRGLSAVEAAQAARRHFGSVAAAREQQRDARALSWVGDMWRDVGYAARGVWTRPGFTAATVAILGLAIGINGAFFSLYSQYVLKPLPIRGVDRHVAVTAVDRNGRAASTWNTEEIDALRERAGREMEGFYTSDTFQVLAVAPVQRQTFVTGVSGDYFTLLGGTATFGRTLSEADARVPVAVLSNSGAARFFPGGNPVGQTLRVRATALTVVGVMPPAFTGTDAITPDLWVGRATEDTLRGRPASDDTRRDLFGLVAPGAAANHVEALLTATAAHFPRPQGAAVSRVELRPQRSLLPGGDELGAAAVLLFAAFWMVLLIACANLANLHLARASTRVHELGMRRSLGASRWRLIRQLLTESTFTALVGATAGCLLSMVILKTTQDYATSLSGVEGLLAHVDMDWRVLAYAAGLGIVAGIAFGLLPALVVTSSAAASTTRERARFKGRIGPRRVRDVLIGCQVAASLVLLIIGGVLIRNIERLDVVDVGYDLDRVFDLRLDRPTAPTLDTLGRQPGVVAITAVARVPLYGRGPRLPITVNGRTRQLSYNAVDDRFFGTMSLRVEGRSFTRVETTSGAHVAVISQATARQLWPGSSPLGRTFVAQPTFGDTPVGTYEVIGVAPDVVSGWLFEGKDASAIYVPAAAGQPGIDSTMARITGNPARTIAALRAVCATGTDATGCEPASLREISALQRLPFRIAAASAGVLGGLALLLTAIGLYSVASYAVVQRRREIGILLALGALPSQVLRRVLMDAWRCVALGILAGLPVCLGLSKLASSSVFQIQTFDPAAYAAVPLLLILLATLACAGPARRASRMEPVASLREE